MYSRASINYWDLVSCLSQAADLVAPEVVNHHYQVSYICLCLGQTMGLSRQRRNHLTFAGALHDIGGLTRESRLICLDFEAGDADMHAWFGYALLKQIQALRRDGQTGALSPCVLGRRQGGGIHGP